MAKTRASIHIKTNAKDWVKYLNEVPEKTQLYVDGKIPKLRSNTRKNVRSHLTKGHGVDEGIYRKSFIINNFAESKWHVGFQVFAKKPHYRLTHLLEDGHILKVFRWGGSERTKWGNYGMEIYHKNLPQFHILHQHKSMPKKQLPIYTKKQLILL